MSAETVSPAQPETSETDTDEAEFESDIRDAVPQLRSGEAVTDLPSPAYMLMHEAVITMFPLKKADKPKAPVRKAKQVI